MEIKDLYASAVFSKDPDRLQEDEIVKITILVPKGADTIELYAVGPDLKLIQPSPENGREVLEPLFFSII